MDMQEIMTMIGSYGFPIVMCLLMVFMNREQRKDHTEEVALVRKVVEENTRVIIQLSDKMDALYDKVDK